MHWVFFQFENGPLSTRFMLLRPVINLPYLDSDRSMALPLASLYNRLLPLRRVFVIVQLEQPK